MTIDTAQSKFKVFFLKKYIKAFPLLSLIVSVFCLSTCLLQAQEDSSFVFHGQLLDENSAPVKDVYLINYRTLKYDRTNVDGRFDIDVLPSDSLKIYHVSYESLIIHAYESDTIPVYQLPYEIYELFESNVSVVVKQRSVYEEILLKNFDSNWDRMLDQMQSEFSYKPASARPKMPSDSLMMQGEPVVSRIMPSARGGGLNAGLSIEGICNSVKKIKARLQGGKK